MKTHTYILESKGYYMVKFYNPLTKLTNHIGTFNSFNEAYSEYGKYQSNFYSDKKYLLPKSINLISSTGKFRVGFNVKRSNGRFGSIYIGTYNTLEEADKAKKDFITSII